MNDKLMETIQQLQSLAPKVWETLLTQVRYESFTSIFWGVVCGFITYVSYSFTKRTIYPLTEVDDSYYALVVVGSIITLGLGLLSLNYFVHAFRYLVNPEFYAIMYVFKAVK